MGFEENEYVQLIGHKPQYTGIIQTTGGVKNVAAGDSVRIFKSSMAVGYEVKVKAARL